MLTYGTAVRPEADPPLYRVMLEGHALPCPPLA